MHFTKVDIQKSLIIKKQEMRLKGNMLCNQLFAGMLGSMLDE